MTSPTPDELVEAATIEQADETGRVLEQRAASKAERPGLTVTNDGRAATLIGQPTSGEPEPIEDFLRAFGLDPAEWLVISCTVNRWESAAKVGTEWIKTKLHQKKAVLKHVLPAVLPARTDGPLWTPSQAIEPAGERPLLVMLLGDQQAPFHDPALHELVCEWIYRERPDWLVEVGDCIDLPEFGKFTRNPALVSADLDAMVQRGVDVTYSLLRDYTQAGKRSVKRRDYIDGNHEYRLLRYLLEKAPQLAAVKRPGESRALNSVPYWLRLDELGWTWVPDNSDHYPNSKLTITPKLRAFHGWIASSKSGASGLRHLERLGHSIAHGHTHRLAHVHHTYEEVDGTPRIHTAIETGCLCLRNLGYDPAPNWQPGFAVLRVFADGTFIPTLVPYVNGRLLYEGRAYRHSAKGVRVA